MLLEHGYGDRVRILDDVALLTLLARIGSPDTPGALLPGLVRSAYQRLAHDTLARDFPRTHASLPTRMTAREPRALWTGPVLCRSTRLVICAVVRAGLLPAQHCYELACELLPPENVRLDYVTMQRHAGADGRVDGVHLHGARIGGSVAGAVLWIPDPMGATGTTVARTLEAYREVGAGAPRDAVAMHLMVTPEAIAARAAAVRIVAGRVDRGLSPPEVLAAPPGVHAALERGLDDHDYVIPGAGGMGELLTNSWI